MLFICLASFHIRLFSYLSYLINRLISSRRNVSCSLMKSFSNGCWALKKITSYFQPRKSHPHPLTFFEFFPVFNFLQKISQNIHISLLQLAIHFEIGFWDHGKQILGRGGKTRRREECA